MEELQTTDVLDREILEDARRKAKRILATAEETVAAGAASWEKRLDRNIGDLKKSFAARVEKAREERMARLPLDKRRAHSEQVEALLVAAMGEYLGSLSRERILALLEQELCRCAAGLPESGSGALEAGCRSLSREELAALLGKAFPGMPWTYRETMGFHQVPGSFPAVIVNSPAARITASVDVLAASVMADSRAELVSALLGPDALSENFASGGGGNHGN